MKKWARLRKIRIYAAAFALIPFGLLLAGHTTLAIAFLTVGLMEASAFADAYRTGYLTPDVEDD